MTRKQKRVVRRKSRPTKGKHSEIKKRSRKAANARKGGMGGTQSNARKPARTKARSKSRTKAAKRKHATRKRNAPRKQQQRKSKSARVKKSRRSARQTEEDIFDEGEDFIGPIGDSYDQDFADVDWLEVDWSDVIDDIGEEELDSYGENAK